VRKNALFFCAALCLAAPTGLQAQDPGAAQDAEAAREKLLKASDELDNIQANSETTRASVDGVKTDVATLQQNVTALQNENTALKQQLADLQTQFDQYKADQARERQLLIDNVADMIAKSADKSTRKKKPSAETTDSSDSAPAPTPETSTEVHTSLASTEPSLAPPPDNPAAGTADDTPPPVPKKEKGYNHIVAPGETVPMIAAAYRDAGIKVTAAEIRKANGLAPDSVLTPGQKIFIPKPGM
jgi:regulator of replication initiation timing